MSKERLRVGIVGASGYAGTELFRLLHQHNQVEVTYISGNHAESGTWSQVRPYFPGYDHLNMQAYDEQTCVEKCDFVFVALPSGASGLIAAALWQKGLKVIDLSGDLRLNSEDYEAWYGKPACSAKAVESAVYGMTEWNRQEISEARLIANPGCYATAVVLALRPLASLEQVRTHLPIMVDAKSGVSGAGKKAADHLLHGELDGNFYPYKVGGHQHTPEIQRYSGLEKPVLLTTQLLPMARGIYANAYVHFQGALTREDVYDAFRSAYEDEYFITVHAPDEMPQLKHVRGSNRCHIGFHVDIRTGVLQLFSVIDNLQKGAAGQAVQNMNVMMGFDEQSGLNAISLYP